MGFVTLALALTFLLSACSGGEGAAASSGDGPPGLSAVEEAREHGVDVAPATGDAEDAAPEFTGLTRWLNSPPLTLEELQGQVVLVDFWTYT